MKVVSNSGPLIALARLGRLGLLNQLYDAVLIPPEVYQEVVVNGRLCDEALAQVRRESMRS